MFIDFAVVKDIAYWVYVVVFACNSPTLFKRSIVNFVSLVLQFVVRASHIFLTTLCHVTQSKHYTLDIPAGNTSKTVAARPKQLKKGWTCHFMWSFTQNVQHLPFLE